MKETDTWEISHGDLKVRVEINKFFNAATAFFEI